MHFFVLVFILCLLFFLAKDFINILVDVLAIFLLGDENTNVKITCWLTCCKITADILDSTVLCDFEH